MMILYVLTIKLCFFKCNIVVVFNVHRRSDQKLPLSFATQFSLYTTAVVVQTLQTLPTISLYEKRKYISLVKINNKY